MKNHDGVNFPALYFLLRECNIVQRITDPQDRCLLSLILHRVCHPDLLTVNRYRLSASPDYFVPNKTVYADYIAFIKELPGVQDHAAFNVTANSWRRRQECQADQLVAQLVLASKFRTADVVEDAAAECRAVLEALPEEVAPLVPSDANGKARRAKRVVEDEALAYGDLVTDIRTEVRGGAGDGVLDLSGEGTAGAAGGKEESGAQG